MKRQYNLYLDIEAIEILKSKGMDNFSAFCNAMLMQEAELKNNTDDPNSALKIANAKLITTINTQKLEIEALRKEIKESSKKSKTPSHYPNLPYSSK